MTFYEVMRITADEVELIVQDKNGKIIECMFVREAKTLPNHLLFDEKVLERIYCKETMRLLIKLDYTAGNKEVI